MDLLNNDYTGKDYDSLVAKADKIASLLLPEWTARDDNDINWVTIKTVAYLLSIGMFYIDLGVSEQDPYTVQIYKNALNCARRYGYPVKKYVGATTTLDVTIKEHTVTKTMARGTKFTSAGKSYCLLEDIVYPVGVNCQSAPVQYGSWSRIALGTSSGEAFQQFDLKDATVQSDGVRLFINEGLRFVEWGKRNTLLMSRKADTHFRQVLQEDETYSFLFGDSKSGKIPNASARLEVEVITMPPSYINDNYGNLPKGNKFTCEDSDVVLIVQSEAAVGGGDKESILEIGKNLPQWLSTSDRVVAPNDAVYLARRVAGVEDAAAFQDSVVLNLYIIPTGGGKASSALMNKVQEYLEDRKIELVTINVLVPNQVTIDFTAVITPKEGFARNAVLGAVIDEMNSYLNQSSTVGTLLTLMEAYSICRSVSGVKNIHITKFCRSGGIGVDDIQLSVQEVALPGTVDITLSGLLRKQLSGYGIGRSSATGEMTLILSSDHKKSINGAVTSAGALTASLTVEAGS